MSLDANVASFVPSALVARTEPTDNAQTPGHAAGYAAGFAAGTRAASEAAAAQRLRVDADHERREAERDAEVRRAIGALSAAAARWENRVAPVLDEAERTLHEAALVLAEAVLARELTPGPASARTALARALTLPDDIAPTRIRLHPADLEHAQRALEDGEVTLPDGVALTADPSLAPGDALTDYEGGVLDARIAASLDRARRVLLEEEAQ